MDFNTTNDNLLIFQERAIKVLYELVWCDSLEELDFLTFDLLQRIDHIINKKERLIKNYLKYERWNEKNEGI